MNTADIGKIEAKVLWLYGLSGAGKTTLAIAFAQVLREAMHPAVVLDGDRLRMGMCQDLAFSSEDRQENVRRTAELAKLLCEQGLIVVVALMTPHESMRQMARSIIGDKSFKAVFVKCDYAVCASRDTKGLYARAAAGNIHQFPGKDFVFEEPARSDLVLDTATESIPACIHSLIHQFADST
ncbi:adenylyl-sulfate kinase [Prosthecobacter fluviatilis]|uniref:Adenylyl-sulfate kinase n=1 Tax=Prosthecobacter fluviatilis TaxID=445931 RepID=A0ABW0KZN9_9BACT